MLLNNLQVIKLTLPLLWTGTTEWRVTARLLQQFGGLQPKYRSLPKLAATLRPAPIRFCREKTVACRGLVTWGYGCCTSSRPSARPEGP